MAKIFEFILNSRLIQSFTPITAQFGFRKGKNTTDAITRITKIYEHHTKNNNTQRRPLLLLNLDIKNAFNSVSWQDIIETMYKRKIPLYTIETMKSYLSNRFLVFSDFIIKLAAQGGCLSPTIWLLIFDEILNLNTTPEIRKQTYANDTLLIITGTNMQEIQITTKIVTEQIKQELKKKDLITEDRKTEALLLHGPRKAGEIDLLIGKAQITAGPSLTSLGFKITRAIRMNLHIKASCEKAKKVANHFRPLLPNLHGPTLMRRKLMIHAVLSIIFYGVTTWAADCNTKKNREEIRKTLKSLKLALCCAYRTTSDFCLNVISGIPSETILIKEKISKYNKEDPEEIQKYKIARWTVEWESSLNKWIKRLIPELHLWIKRRHGQPDFFLTQFLTGHGAFADYLYKFKKRHNLHCPYCTNETKDTVFVGTWNVNGQSPTCKLNQWLSVEPEPPDIYAVGFQELDLSKEAFLFNDTPREEEWQNAVIAALHPMGRYRKVALVRLVGMMLLVFAQEQHAPHIRDVATETVGTGIMGKLGNKGGVAVRFDLHSSSLCFVNSHLAAHVEEFERRNQDYHDICSRISFSKFLPPKSIKDHDQIYWLGDLNYRITDMDVNLVKSYIEKENYKAIIEYDQLKQQHKKGNVFVNYKEGEINFRPTYKYDTGTDDWDSSEKNRAPAWCDRVLWKGDAIHQLSYQSHPSLRISDHKPVSAVFNSEIRFIDAQKYRKIHEEVMKKLDKLENEFLPQVTVEQTEIVFNSVRFMEPQTKELIIANNGQVPVQFEFIKKLDEGHYCKDWLNIEPFMGFIMTGEKCDIKLEIYVDKQSASKLNAGQDKLSDILVLHLKGGKDIFITVTGSYERSCFGSSLEALARISVPVKEIPAERLKELPERRGEVGLAQDDTAVVWHCRGVDFCMDHD
ncbi:unnamed protein product [Bemisia tabaci]|uniref:Reverse transcriptase domain-containing protein n=1 Tax=Bemisia tabaci TaxID=7038 RepID=A0A9N9ZZQ1_BEMTA|nr:unnamed protein product [Bemisia tabaci]